MKHTIRILLALAVLLMSGSAAWAQRIAVSTGIANGTVVPDNANPTGTTTVMLTVTPATGYYITVSDISVTRTALGAHARHQSPAIGETIAVTAASVDATGKGTYTFDVEDGYGAYVEATFTACSAITPTVSITGWTYGSVANEPTVTGNTGNGTVTYNYKVKGTADDTYSATVPTAAGDYTVRATIAAAGHYLGNTATTDFTISKKDIVISGIKANNKVYDGNTSATLDYSEVVYSGIVTGDELTVTATGAFEDANVGTNKTVNITGLTLGGTSIANYILAAEGQQTTTTADITAIGAAIVTAPTAIDRTYDGTAKDLVEAGTATNGTLQYRLNTTDAWTATIPQATDAGTYKVYYKVKGDANYDDQEFADPIAVTISKAAVTVTITGHYSKAAYDGTEHSVSGYEVSISDPLLYKETDFTFTGTASAKRTDPGMTSMGLADDQFTNNNTNFTVTFNVTDGYLTITSPDEVIVMITGHSSTDDYDGTEHSVSGYDVSISNPLYKESDFTFTGTANAARTDAGTTNMGLNKSQFTNNNKNFTVTFSVTDGYQTISPIAVTVTVTGHYNTVTYDGTEHSVSGYDVSFSNKLYKESDITFTGTATAARTDEGKTDMGLTTDQFTNNNANFNPVTFNVIDGYQTITSVTDVVVTITGSNNTADYDGKAHSVNGYEVSISNPLYKETDFTFNGTATATRTDAGTTNMGLDPSQFKNNNGDFTNVTFEVTDGYQTISPIKATVTIKGHNNIAIYDGTAHSVSGYDVSFSNDLYKEADFTFTGTASTARTDQGTAYMGLAEDQFANTNANFSIVTFNVIDGYQTINKKLATLTVTVTPKTYDGKTEATVSVTVETGVKGETMTINGLTGAFDTANAGTDKTVTLNSSNANVKVGANTKLDNYEVNYPTQANGTITKRPVVVSGITAQDKDYDGTTDATLVFDDAQFDGILAGDNLTVTATGAFEDAEAGENKIVNITGLTLDGTSVSNYMLAAEGQQETTTASIREVETIDRHHSGIEVRRNDTGALVDNEAFLTRMTDGTLRIDRVNIINPDPVNGIAVGVSVYIPASLTDADGKTKGDTYGVGSDIIITDANVPVTDIYMPDTEDILEVAKQAFRLIADESTTARIHTSLPLLDDYALTAGLKAEYEAGHVLTTITPTTQYWTFSSGVDVVVPENVTAYICYADGLDAVAAITITNTKATVNDKERVIVKANNGVMMGCGNDNGGTFDIYAWPSEDRPSGTKPTTEDAKTYENNMMVPALVKTHFEPSEYYILYNNTFHELEPDDDTSVSPCKAVLRKSNPAMARILSIHNESVGIYTIYNDSLSEEGKWFSLDGRRLNGKPTAKGIYIHNGKKTFIK